MNKVKIKSTNGSKIIAGGGANFNGNVEFEGAGFVNEKGAIANIEGKLTTDSLIQNKGIWNTAKSSEVIIKKSIENFASKHPWWFAIISGLITSAIWSTVHLIKNL